MLVRLIKICASGCRGILSVAEIERELNEVGKALPHGDGSVRARTIRKRECFQLRPHFGFSKSVIAEIEMVGEMSAPTGAIVRSAAPLPEEYRVLFVEKLSVPVSFEVHPS